MASVLIIAPHKTHKPMAYDCDNAMQVAVFILKWNDRSQGSDVVEKWNFEYLESHFDYTLEMVMDGLQRLWRCLEQNRTHRHGSHVHER